MKYTRTVYVYKGEQYNTITEIRRLPDLMNTSIPNNPTDEQLAALGVSREEVMVSLAEAKNIKLNELYGIYMSSCAISQRGTSRATEHFTSTARPRILTNSIRPIA